MFNLLLTTGFSLEIDKSPLTLHENRLGTRSGCGVMLLAIFMYRTSVGL